MVRAVNTGGLFETRSSVHILRVARIGLSNQHKLRGLCLATKPVDLCKEEVPIRDAVV